MAAARECSLAQGRQQRRRNLTGLLLLMSGKPFAMYSR
jgi:hypothetical protein